MEVIAHIYNDLQDKFGIPRQSGLVSELTGKIIFEPEYRVKEAFDGLEEFSHIWLLWQFSENIRDQWSPTVRPPRLGGEKRKGVFATRSPFRPNGIGLSCVKLESVEFTKNYGPVITVSGIDLMNNTPIYDIKPYIAYTDSHPDATEGFASDVKDYFIEVEFYNNTEKLLTDEQRKAVRGILSQDPRPAYHDDPNRIYAIRYAEYDIKFTVKDNCANVVEVIKIESEK